MNYSELLQLAKGWGNFISDRIIILRLPLIGTIPSTAEAKNVVSYITEVVDSININNYVEKVDGSRLMTDVEGTKLAGIADGATKTESSDTNGNVKINGTDVVVYTEPTDVVHGSIATSAEVTEMLNEVFGA